MTCKSKMPHRYYFLVKRATILVKILGTSHKIALLQSLIQCPPLNPFQCLLNQTPFDHPNIELRGKGDEKVLNVRFHLDILGNMTKTQKFASVPIYFDQDCRKLTSLIERWRFFHYFSMTIFLCRQMVKEFMLIFIAIQTQMFRESSLECSSKLMDDEKIMQEVFDTAWNLREQGWLNGKTVDYQSEDFWIKSPTLSGHGDGLKISTDFHTKQSQFENNRKILQ